MPQRSNEFQHLVRLVHQALVPHGATVTESAMVSAPGFGDLREIDVLIELPAQPYRLKIAIEAKDHKRKLNVTDVEAILGKYRVPGSLLTNETVVVSRNGYTNQAARKAAVNGLKLLTLSEAQAFDWTKCGRLGTQQHLHFRIAPHVASIEVRPSLNDLDPAEVITKGEIICTNGASHGSPSKHANHLLNCHLLKDKNFISNMKAALQHHPLACAKLVKSLPGHRLRLSEAVYPIESIAFHIHASDTKTPIEFRAYELSGEGNHWKVARGTATVGNKRIQIIVPDGKHPEKLVVDISDACDA